MTLVEEIATAAVNEDVVANTERPCTPPPQPPSEATKRMVTDGSLRTTRDTKRVSLARVGTIMLHLLRPKEQTHDNPPRTLATAAHTPTSSSPSSPSTLPPGSGLPKGDARGVADERPIRYRRNVEGGHARQ